MASVGSSIDVKRYSLILIYTHLFYAKIVQTESRTSSLLECYAEVQPILCKDIDYLRNRNDLSRNNSTLNNSTSAKPTILALASGTADYKTQHCALRNHSTFRTHNSKFINPYQTNTPTHVFRKTSGS